VRAEVEAAVAAEPLIASFSLSPGAEATDTGATDTGATDTGATDTGATDLAVRLYLTAGDWQPAVNRAASRIAGRLAGRLRRGVEFSVVPGPA
jgi:hypothetical protein